MAIWLSLKPRSGKIHLKSQIEQHGGDAWPLQGSPEKGVVVLRFPSEESVRDFVNDPEYQPAKELRIAVTTNANAVQPGLSYLT